MNSTHPSLSLQLNPLKEVLSKLDEPGVVQYFELLAGDRVLKTTLSICSTCLQNTVAVVFTRNHKVLIRKHCLAHGFLDALLENDQRFYYLSNKDQWGRHYAKVPTLNIPQQNKSCCGPKGCASTDFSTQETFFTDQSANKTCTILVEITDACNLSCQVCYADSKGDRKLSLELFKVHMNQLLQQKAPLDSVQITGGEAALHPEFWQMLEFLYQHEGIKKIFLPTNGVLYREIALARKLAQFRTKLMVLLQFDGFEPKTDQQLRNANLHTLRLTVIRNMGKYQIPMQLTMTVAHGINAQEIGKVVKLGLKHSHIRVFALQPTTYSGRYETQTDAMQRLTLSDMVKAVVAQAGLTIQEKEFSPIPCSHPNCGWITLFVRRFGIIKNISRYIDLETQMETVANKMLLSTAELQRSLEPHKKGIMNRILLYLGKKLVRSTDVFTIAIKPFMDRFNYDQDRISSCCHHLMDTEGRVTSFCEYNARLRIKDSWEKFSKLSEVVH